MSSNLAPVCSVGPTLAPLAVRLKAAADGLRLEILQVLGLSSFGVLELCEILAMRQSGMSHHLKVLAQAALVESRREGNAIYYRRGLPAANDDLHQALLEQVDAVPLSAQVSSRLTAVQIRRTEQSRAFFARHADNLSGQQELIADYPQYADLAAELLQRARPNGGALAVEIGPGEGQFLALLAASFERVSGYDSSEAMLQRAQQFVQAQQLNNVDLVLGEWPAAAPDTAQADAVVLNMVLHHLPAPADSLMAAARRLKVGGVLLVTELCRHDQSWAHQSCGDLWLGFEEEELLAWAKRAGLAPLESQYLAQRNGFQVQVCTFVRSGKR